MTVDNRFAPPPAAARTWVCPRCRVRQVDVGWPRCANCELPRHRWVAHPPPGGPPAKAAPPPEPPYLGPPSYRGRPPRWAFPPVVWQDADPDADTERRPTDPSGVLRVAAVLAGLAAVVCLTAAAAESWRFALMLEGRTKVLPGTTVWASDVFVAAAGAGAVAAAVAALVVSVIALVRTHRVAALRRHRAPSRSRVAVLSRLLVPGWNLYGAGQIVTEIDRLLGAERAPDGRGRASRLTVCWWVSWIASAALMAAALLRGFGGSLQAIADTVELHIAVDLAGALCAGLGAAMLWRFARLLRPRSVIPDGWVVREPVPTRG
jgi:hypothetical protein